MQIKANLILDANDLIDSCGLEKHGEVQKYIDNFVMTRSDEYTPGKHINDSARPATKIGEGQVIWNSPDANYLYEGKLMVDPFAFKGAFFNPDYGFWSRPGVQKIMDPQGRDLQFHLGGERGDHWFDRMIEDNMDDLLTGIVKVIEENGKH